MTAESLRAVAKLVTMAEQLLGTVYDRAYIALLTSIEQHAIKERLQFIENTQFNHRKIMLYIILLMVEITFTTHL